MELLIGIVYYDEVVGAVREKDPKHIYDWEFVKFGVSPRGDEKFVNGEGDDDDI